MKLTIAENIRRLRKEHSMTQENLAEALGVTVGAVYKWESGRAVPDISLIVEMSAFFEISVDVLLGYELHRSSAQEAVENLRNARNEKRLEDGKRIAEAALQKYPNIFNVVFESALIYYVSLNDKDALRAISLFEHAIELIDQNTDEDISTISIENSIASCYIILEQQEKALELLKRNNVESVNSSMIGVILSQHFRKPDEALEYLSDALAKCIVTLCRTVIGYQSAYALRKQYDQGLDISAWLHRTILELCEPGRITCLHKTDAFVLAVCAMFSLYSGDRTGAYSYLREARSTALAFDASPEYSLRGIRFFHGDPDTTTYDDLGETAIDSINHFIGSSRKVGGCLNCLPLRGRWHDQRE